MILDIDRSARGPQIILSRSHPDFLKKLFTLEVPEISEGTIEIKGVAREPGERAKISVYSSDSGVDPVGACVGIKGSRVQAVVQELRGERIDIIPWTPDEPSFVARALSPAEVTRVVLDEDNHSMEVIVADDQLSLAIGRRGQNVKLASKLSGWKLDVRSVSVAEEESKRARVALEAIPDMAFTDAELLFQEGYRSVREIADATIEDLLEVATFTAEKAETVIRNAKEYVAKRELDGEDDESLQSSEISDLDKLKIPAELREKLMTNGFRTIQGLVSTQHHDLVTLVGLSEDELQSVKDATDEFFRGGSSLFSNRG